MPQGKYNNDIRPQGTDPDNHMTQTWEMMYGAVLDRRLFRGRDTFNPDQLFTEKRSIRKSRDMLQAGGFLMKGGVFYIKRLSMFDIRRKWEGENAQRIMDLFEFMLDKEQTWCILNGRPHPEFTICNLGELAQNCEKRRVSASPNPKDMPQREKSFTISNRERMMMQREKVIEEKVSAFVADMKEADFLYKHVKDIPELLIKVVLVERFSHPEVPKCRVVKIVRKYGLTVMSRWVTGEEARIVGLNDGYYKLVNLRKALDAIDWFKYKDKILTDPYTNTRPDLISCESCGESIPDLIYNKRCFKCRVKQEKTDV